MAITVEVKPDLSRFRGASEDQIVAVLRELAISEADARAAAKALLDKFVILPG